MLVLSIQLKTTTLKDMVEKTDHLWAFIKIGCGMLNPVAWNSPNNSSATLESASAEGFRGSILFITLEAYSVVECNTQDCLNTQKVHAWSENLWHQIICLHTKKQRHQIKVYQITTKMTTTRNYLLTSWVALVASPKARARPPSSIQNFFEKHAQMFLHARSSTTPRTSSTLGKLWLTYPSFLRWSQLAVWKEHATPRVAPNAPKSEMPSKKGSNYPTSVDNHSKKA